MAKEGSSDYKKVRKKCFFKEPLTEWFFVEPKMVLLRQGCQTQFLEGHSPAEFCSNPAPTHIPCSFQISLKDLISWIRCV